MEEPRDPTGYYKLGQEMEGSWIMIRKRNGMKIGKCKKDFGKIREASYQLRSHHILHVTWFRLLPQPHVHVHGWWVPLSSINGNAVACFAIGLLLLLLLIPLRLFLSFFFLSLSLFPK